MGDEKRIIEEARDYPYRVVYPSPDFLKERGFDRVAHLPLIFDHRPGYHRHPKSATVTSPGGPGERRSI